MPTSLSVRDILAAGSSGEGAKALKTMLDQVTDLANQTKSRVNTAFLALFRGSAALTYANPAALTSAALTDNSGGTANTTVEACGAAVTGVDGVGSNAASKADVDTRLASIANNFADVVAQVNALRTDLGAVRTAVIALGADVSTAVDGGAPHHAFYDDATTLADTPRASTVDNDTIFDLANALKDAYEAHRARVAGVHNAADATNTIAAADATDLASAYTLLNELKADYNLHRVESGKHFMSDATNVITSPNANSAGTAVTLANELLDDLLAHLRYTTDVYADDIE